MRPTRRSMIIDLRRQAKTDREILAELGRKFPPGTFSTSNAQALSGVKREFGDTARTPRQVSASSPRPDQLSLLNRDELIGNLRSFNVEPVIKEYQQGWMWKTPRQILAASADKTIFRAFRIIRQVNQEAPSLRYMRWRWHRNPEQLLSRLEAIKSQEEFDRFAQSVGESLVEDWGERNEHGELTGMNIGVAMKITNLVFKHLSFSPHCHNLPRLIHWLHVPWDSRTLMPLRGIWTGSKPIPYSPSQGFVDTISLYQELHSFITGIAQESGIYRIIYEFYAWDGSRKTPRQNDTVRRSQKKESRDTAVNKSFQRELNRVENEEKAERLFGRIKDERVLEFLNVLMESINKEVKRTKAVTNEFKFWLRNSEHCSFYIRPSSTRIDIYLEKFLPADIEIKNRPGNLPLTVKKKHIKSEGPILIRYQGGW
jgi:hypothetical protein